jgi:ATP-dependent DNA ligase
MHGGAAGSGAQPGNQNALKHGRYTAAAIRRPSDLDGEIVALDERGASNFATLQQALSGSGMKANLA